MSQATTSTRQLVIIDSQVNNYQRLVSGIGPDTAVLILDATTDGLTQISDYLTALPDQYFQSIQIISHGSAGRLLLGSSTVTGNNLGMYDRQLATIGKALTEKGDILLYGCNVAADQAGMAFINQFADLTGAEVAASDDITGGLGNWQLEAATGAVEATSAINAATLQSYDDSLAIPVVNATAGITPVEGKTAGTFTVSLDSPAPTGGLTVNYSLAGTAALTADYTVSAGSNVTAVTGGSFTVAEGQSSATLVVNAVGDGVVDGGETVELSLSVSSVSGTVSFAPAELYAMNDAPLSLALADLNGDGKSDLITGNNLNNKISVRLGLGDGSFGSTSTYAVDVAPVNLVLLCQIHSRTT